MALTDENGGMVMPVSPMGGYGNNCFGGDGWWVILFLFALMGNNGFGGWGGNDGVMPYFYNTQTQNDVNRGFADANLAGQISGIQASVNNGFANAEIAACGRAMDAMNQRFTDTTALNAQINSLAMGLQNCCCENRQSIADLKYTVATEACADRSAINDALRDVLTANTASTQKILDQMCQDKIDAKNEKIAELQNQLTMANLAASQALQTQQLIANNEAQTAALEQYLAPTPRPAYVVQNPNCCPQNYGCGCGNF